MIKGFQKRTAQAMTMIQFEHKHEMGSGGNCICPKCDSRIPHRDGIPCREERCPECGAKMFREGSEHHRLLLEKRARQKT
jgi:predicted amidophosphoribosyltransferase